MNFYKFLFLLCLISSCKSSNPDVEEQSPTDENSLPAIKDESEFIYSWFENKTAKTATSIDKIPEEFRKKVRIQDPTIPVEKRNPQVIILADLTKKNKDGTYIVKTQNRADYESRIHGENNEHTASQTQKNTEIIMYATPHCSACRKARNWLLKQGLPYKEIDISQNQQAARELTEKGAKQGIPTSGVPIFEINNKLIPGFDPDMLLKSVNQN